MQKNIEMAGHQGTNPQFWTTKFSKKWPINAFKRMQTGLHERVYNSR